MRERKVVYQSKRQSERERERERTPPPSQRAVSLGDDDTILQDSSVTAIWDIGFKFFLN